jgi:hypothetical protein
MIGNVLEWYDFAIYGYFAAQIGRHFFPHEDAVGCGTQPVGFLQRSALIFLRPQSKLLSAHCQL